MFPILVEYGHGTKYVNITIQALQCCLYYDTLVIPAEDEKRNELFGDPFFGVFKSIAVTDDDGKKVYPIGQIVKHVIEEKKNEGMRALNNISWAHSRVKFIDGITTFKGNDYCIAQVLCALFLPVNANVLEIGAGTGRNSLVISSTLLSNPLHLVSLECDPNQYLLLQENLIENHLFAFYTENVAIANTPIIQKDGITSPIPKDGILPADYELVDTMTFLEVQTKYKLCFSALIVDCGHPNAFLCMLQEDMDNILKNIQTIILINASIEEKILMQHGLQKIFQYPGGPQNALNYYEVWKNNSHVTLHV